MTDRIGAIAAARPLASVHATCHAIAATATAIIAGDDAGAVWFLDWPSPDAHQGSTQVDRRPDNQPTPSSDREFPAQRPPTESPQARSKADPTQPRHDPYVAYPETGETRMTADDLFELLSKLLPAQFEAVLFRAKVPVEYLPAATAPQTERAIATIATSSSSASSTSSLGPFSRS